MVLGAGFEPARDYSHQILSLMWLPLHHPSISFFVSPIICCCVTVATQKLKIVKIIIGSITIYMVNLQRNIITQPFTLQAFFAFVTFFFYQMRSEIFYSFIRGPIFDPLIFTPKLSSKMRSVKIKFGNLTFNCIKIATRFFQAQNPQNFRK